MYSNLEGRATSCLLDSIAAERLRHRVVSSSIYGSDNVECSCGEFVKNKEFSRHIDISYLKVILSRKIGFDCDTCAGAAYIKENNQYIRCPDCLGYSYTKYAIDILVDCRSFD